MAASIRFVDADGFTTLVTENWPNAFAGANQQPRKFGIENNGTRVLGSSPGPATGFQIAIQQIGGNDGFTEFRIIPDIATVSPPYGLTTALGGGGGNFGATGVYGWKVTATNATGETIGSFEATFNVTDTTKQVVLTWTGVSGATGYKVYRTPTPGTYGATTLVATLGNTTTFTDPGNAASAGTPPLQNTTGDWLQTTPVQAAGGSFAAGTYFWTIAAFDSTGVLLAISHESTLTVSVNNKVTLAWPSVTGAATYSVFRSTTPGVYASPSLIVSALVPTTFVDTGAAASAGSLTNPQSSVLQSFGFAPAGLSTQTLPITVGSGNLAVGQQFFFWCNRVISGATPESGNPRDCVTTAQEF